MSTGFIVARAITPYVDTRGLAKRTRSRAPCACGRDAPQDIYLGASYWAIAHGLGAGVMALLGSLQPLLTAAIASRLFGERLSKRAWGGMMLGLISVAGVLAPKLAVGGGGHISESGFAPWLVVGIGSVLAITAGTLYRIRRHRLPLRTFAVRARCRTRAQRSWHWC